MRKEIVKKYVDKYSLGVTDIENSLIQYNSFFKNMGFNETIEELIEKRLEDKVFVRIMDIGCGNGGFLADLKKKFDEQIHTIGVDLLAPEKHPDQSVLGDAFETAFPKEIDFVFSFRTLHEIGEPEKIVEKIQNSLAVGGKAFLSFRTLDLYSGGKGIAEIQAKEVKQLQQMVRQRKLKGFSVNGFEVSVKDEKGKNQTAGVNLFLEK
ncbi:MAG: class I SAM-dependent methyltransferase [archaeon]|nr:class I SAM-dependent methyltransferase [archaeon]